MVNPNATLLMSNVSEEGGISTTPGPRYPALSNIYNTYFHVHGYLALLVCVWGICANMANIIVLTRKNMKSSTNTLLTGLAVADLMTMLSYLPISIVFYILHDPKLTFPSSREYGWIVFMQFHISFSVVCHTVAIWLTITLAMFRYLYICHPTQGKSWCTIKSAKLAILAVYCLTTVLCIPHYMSIEIDTIYDTDQTSHGRFNSSHISSNEAEKRYYMIKERDNTVLLNFNYWVQSILIKLIPCVLLTILTVLLIIAMHKANRRRQKLMSQGRRGESEREQETNRTTGMLLAIVTLFLITELPQGVLTLCSIFIPWFFSEVYISLGDLLDISALLNNSINFVLYCTMSRQFRETFIKTFCACTEKGVTENSDTTHMTTCRVPQSKPLVSSETKTNGVTV